MPRESSLRVLFTAHSQGLPPSAKQNATPTLEAIREEIEEFDTIAVIDPALGGIVERNWPTSWQSCHQTSKAASAVGLFPHPRCDVSGRFQAQGIDHLRLRPDRVIMHECPPSRGNTGSGSTVLMSAERERSP
jgi:hypothetical protein